MIDETFSGTRVGAERFDFSSEVDSFYACCALRTRFDYSEDQPPRTDAFEEVSDHQTRFDYFTTEKK